MVVVFAKNVTLVVIGAGTPATAFSDPVPMGDADRLASILTVHSMMRTGGTTPSLTFTPQVSTDGGANWVAVTAAEGSASVAGLVRTVAAAHGALLRMKYALLLGTGVSTDVLSCCFDLHVEMDHA